VECLFKEQEQRVRRGKEGNEWEAVEGNKMVVGAKFFL